MTEKTVYIQGTWDLFHVGHLNILRKSYEISGRLIVGINTDESVKRYKGCLPVIPYDDRVVIMGACIYGQKLIKSELILNANQMKKYGIEICVLGSDWKDKKLEGRQEVLDAGIEIRYLPYTERISTTMIKEHIRGEKD